MQEVIQNYRRIEQRLNRLQATTKNTPQKVLILPVSKRQPASSIRTLYEHGVHHFAENYLQEAEQKMDDLSDCTELQWHYIGKIQSKKCKSLAQRMAWVHTVDSLKQATLLSTHCASSEKCEPLNVCIQVNLHQEEQKNGVPADQAASLAREIAPLAHLRLRGFMFMGRFGLTATQQTEAFRQMHSLFQDGQKKLRLMEKNEYDAVQHFDTLSMGMSGDWQNAVSQGATIIRLGTVIFGKRD